MPIRPRSSPLLALPLAAALLAAALGPVAAWPEAPAARGVSGSAPGPASPATPPAGTPVAPADEVPAASRALLLLRILAYDRNLEDRAGSAASVLVLYRAGDRASETWKDGLVRAFEGLTAEVLVRGRSVKVQALPYRDAADLDARLEALRPALVCVDESLASEVHEVARVTRRRHVLSAAGSRPAAEAGLALAITARGGKATVVVNLPAARQEGAELDAALLAVADVIR